MKKTKMNKQSKNVVLFIIIAFLLPLMIVATQSRDLNNAMRFTKNNLISAMTFHFTYNLMIHVAAINPSDNNGCLIPYVTMMIIEVVVLFVLILWDVKRKNRQSLCG